jgi:hypothetical protein
MYIFCLYGSSGKSTENILAGQHALTTYFERYDVSHPHLAYVLASLVI